MQTQNLFHAEYYLHNLETATLRLLGERVLLTEPYLLPRNPNTVWPPMKDITKPTTPRQVYADSGLACLWTLGPLLTSAPMVSTIAQLCEWSSF